MNNAEATFALHLRAYGLERFIHIPQHRIMVGRRFAFDFCDPEAMLAVEIEGQVHSIREKRQGDCVRSNLAVILGWRILRFTPADVRSGKAIDVLRAVVACDLEEATSAALRPSASGAAGSTPSPPRSPIRSGRRPRS